jgi:hypothetical protein
MKRWRLIGGIALMFILGLLAGSVGTRLYYNYRAENIWNDPAARRAFYLDRLTRELGLNGEQRNEFKTLIDEVETQKEAMYVERRAELQRILDEGFSRIKERLSPAQQQKLDELRARHEAQTKKRRGPPRGLL